MKAILFDAYGTLFDVHSVVRACEAAFPGRGTEFSNVWRTKQLEVSWLRGLARQYVSFWQITQDTFDFAIAKLRLEVAPKVRKDILDAYSSLSPFPEVLTTLDQLDAQNIILGTLSNGSPEMLDAVLTSSGLGTRLAHVLSVDRIGRFKPDPAVYKMGVEALNVPSAQILFVSSNAWDIAGASWAGHPTFWVNRGGAPSDPLGVTATYTGATLVDVLPLFAQR